MLSWPFSWQISTPLVLHQAVHKQVYATKSVQERENSVLVKCNAARKNPLATNCLSPGPHLANRNDQGSEKSVHDFTGSKMKLSNHATTRNQILHSESKHGTVAIANVTILLCLDIFQRRPNPYILIHLPPQLFFRIKEGCFMG